MGAGLSDRNFYLVAYDISDDRRRARTARLMESLGSRVQYSVFEAYFTDAELEKTIKRLKKNLEEKEDSLRIYLLCRSCCQKVKMVGSCSLTSPPKLKIV